MHNIHGKMCYSLEQPMWHAIVPPSLEPLGAEKALDNENFKGGFSVNLAQAAWLTDDGTTIPAAGKFFILRAPSEYDPEVAVFGTCTDRYHPLQPRQVCQRFDEMVGKPIETMAFLGDGRDMFISWKMPQISVRPGDDVQMYSIIRGGFSAENGWRLFTAGVRPVCWNTITMAQNWANSNTNGMSGNQWSGKGTNVNLLEHLGYWMQHLQTTAEKEVERLGLFFKALTTVPLSQEEFKDILAETYTLKEVDLNRIPVQLRAKVEKETDEYNADVRKLRDGIFALFAGEGTGITPDLWGGLNATTEYVCHVMPSKKPIAESVMFGNRSGYTQRMVKSLQARLG